MNKEGQSFSGNLQQTKVLLEQVQLIHSVVVDGWCGDYYLVVMMPTPGSQ